MKYLSLFSGVGGFELGIQRAFDNEYAHIGEESEPQERSQGRKRPTDSTVLLQPRNGSAPLCIGYSEIDKYAIETYKSHWKGHKNYGDATKINERELPDFDLLVGGFPCQAFSVAGRRQGFDDTRGTLFFDIARILAHKRPRHLVLENVKGLLSHDSGKTFSTILGVLADLGYLVEWQVLNAKDFGVPQNRERVFIVGHLAGECGGQVFPIARNSKSPKPNIIGTTKSSTAMGTNSRSWVHDTDGIIGAINATEYKQPKQIIDVVGTLETDGWEKRHEQIRRVHGVGGIAPTIPTGTGGGVMTKIGIKSAATRTRAYAGKSETLEVRKDNVSNAINSVTKDYYATDGIRIRRLTPLECERLMSWPDGWTIGSDTQRYKQCGNGVVSNVVQAVITKMQECLV